MRHVTFYKLVPEPSFLYFREYIWWIYLSSPLQNNAGETLILEVSGCVRTKHFLWIFMWMQNKVVILIFLKTMIVLRVSVSVPEIMSISWIDLNKIIMFLVLVYVMFSVWWDIKQVLMRSSLDVYFCFVIILITFLWELSGAKERITLLIEGKHFYKLI